MTHERARSLAGGLSARLALQTFLGLTFVSALVFVAIDGHLIVGQRARLAEMRDLVQHLAEESGSPASPGDLEHLLGDVFAGHADFGLELLDPSADAAAAPVLRAGMVLPDGSSNLSHHDVRVATFGLQAPGGRDLRARLLLHTERDDALLRRLALTLALGVTLGTMINSLAAAWRVRRDLLPVSRLADQIDALDVDSLERRLDGDGQPLELQPLVARFNDLLDRLGGSYRQMAAFNADVAHELNTPLATMTTSNEVALRNERDLDAMRELLGSNLEELQRLTGIVRDMLFLSTAERGARARAVPVSSLAAEARGVVDYHEAALEEAGLDVDITGDAAAQVDARLLRRALSNVIGNATRHAEPGSTIDVHIGGTTRRESHGEISIVVSNTGRTVPAEHLPRLFDRFYRVESGRAPTADASANTPTGARHGLGLSIVAAIAHMHAGRTFARSADGLTSIGIVLPRSPPDTMR